MVDREPVMAGDMLRHLVEVTAFHMQQHPAADTLQMKMLAAALLTAGILITCAGPLLQKIPPNQSLLHQPVQIAVYSRFSNRLSLSPQMVNHLVYREVTAGVLGQQA